MSDTKAKPEDKPKRYRAGMTDKEILEDQQVTADCLSWYYYWQNKYGRAYVKGTQWERIAILVGAREDEDHKIPKPEGEE